MAVAYRSSSTSGTGDAFGTSVTIPVPSGAASGDIALVSIENFAATAGITVTPASGFTELFKVELDSGNSGSRLFVLWKRLSAADTGNYVFTLSSSQWNMGHCILLTGGLASGDPIGSNYATATGTGTSVTSLQVTTSDEPFLAHFVANASDSSKSAPTNYTATQNHGYLMSSRRIPATTGTHTASGATLGTSSKWTAGLVAVSPASSGTAHTQTPTDVAVPTDARAFDVGQVASNNATSTDAQAFDVGQVASDNATSTDAAAFDVGQVASDNAAPTDNAAVESGRLLTQVDSAGVVDVGVFDRAAAVVDSSTPTDAAAFDVGQVASDNAAPTDNAAVESGRLLTQVDSAGVVDVGVFDRVAVVVDSSTPTDAQAFDRAIDVVDSTGLVDTGGPAATGDTIIWTYDIVAA